MTRDDLWAVWDHSLDWMRFQKQQQILATILDRLSTFGIDTSDKRLQRVMKCQEMIRDTQEVIDVIDFIRVVFESELDQIQEQNGQRKPRHAPNSFTALRKSELFRQFETGVTLTVAEFAENFVIPNPAVCQLANPPDEYGVSLSKMVQDALNRDSEDGKQIFFNEKVAIDALVRMHAIQIAADPIIVAELRKVIQDWGVVTVSPTEAGRRIITETHAYYPFKYVTKKRIADFNDDQFLQMLDAESKNLVNISIEHQDWTGFMSLARDCYHVGGRAEAQDWIRFRKEIVEIAFKDMLWPKTVKWLREYLKSQAAQFVTLQIYAKFSGVRKFHAGFITFVEIRLQTV